jgi:hypothetical protein
LVERLALALQGALLVRNGPRERGRLFCASRLAGQHGLAFGTLSAGIDAARIIERAQPRSEPRDARQGQRRGKAMKDFDKRVAVVTGAASGIGLALAHRFARARMKVVLADVESTALEAAARAVGTAGAETLAVRTTCRRPKTSRPRQADDRMPSALCTCCATTPVWRSPDRRGRRRSPIGNG